MSDANDFKCACPPNILGHSHNPACPHPTHALAASLNAKPMTAEEILIEKLASIEHDRWSRWHRYAKEYWEPDRVKRWDELALRLYEELSEDLKEKDREEVRLYFPLIRQACDDAVTEDRNKRTADDLYKCSYEKGFSEAREKAAKVVEEFYSWSEMNNIKTAAERIRALESDK